MLDFVEELINSYFASIPRRKPIHTPEPHYLIAHRGGHDKKLNIQENTLEAFLHAHNMGCEGIEFDIHHTKDNKIIVNHDPTLERLWGYNIDIRSNNLSILKKTVPKLPTLEDVVTLYGKKNASLY